MPSLLLWNVYNLPSVLTRTHNSSPRAHEIARLLSAYDIVVLNEAFVNKTLLTQTGHRWVWAPGRSAGCRALLDSGLLFLSHYPMRPAGCQVYAVRAGWDRFAAKSIARVCVEVEGIEVDVYGTHMQAGASTSAQRARLAQAHQVASFVRPSAHAILAGDLNMGPAMHEEHTRYSHHYVSVNDARGRCSAYEVLRHGAALADVWAGRADVQAQSEICRFLTRGMDGQVQYEDLPAWLSDTPAMCYRW